MFHLQMREFPHDSWRFNMSEQQMLAVVGPWAQGQTVEFDERIWHPEKASLTIFEGPELPLSQLSMGRGRSAAQRKGRDVTAQVLSEVRERAPAGGAAEVDVMAGARTGAGTAQLDPLTLGVQIASLLGSDPLALLEAWRTAAAGSSALKPSESLALAEQALTRGARN